MNLEQYRSSPNAAVILASRACLFWVSSNGTIHWENWNMALALVCFKVPGNFRKHFKYRVIEPLYIGRFTLSVPGDK